MKKKIAYENFYFFLATVSVILSFYGKGRHVVVNRVIYFIFLFEYILRLIKSENKWTFIKNHPADLIVVLPMADFFRIIRLFRIIKILK